MKTIAIAFLSLLLTGIPYSRAAFTTVEGIAGIPFGASLSEVTSAMISHSARYNLNVSKSAEAVFDGGTFNNEVVANWRFFFTNDKMVKATVTMAPPAKHRTTTYIRVRQALIDKYGKPTESTDVDLDSPTLYDQVKGGLVVDATWHIDGRTIICDFKKGGFMEALVQVTYQDDKAVSAPAARVSNDL